MAEMVLRIASTARLSRASEAVSHRTDLLELHVTHV